MLIGQTHDSSNRIRPLARSNSRRLLKESGGWSDGRLARLAECFASIRHRQQIRIRFLHPRQILRSLNRPLQTRIVKLIGRSPRRPPAKIRADGRNAILILNVLMNRVVGKASQCKARPGEEHLDLVRGREPANAVKYLRCPFPA